MINDVATYRLDPHRRLPDSGDLVADLTAWAEEVQTHYSDPTRAALLRGGAASAGERESDCLRDRRAEAEIILGNAAQPPGISVEDVIDGVLAPIVYRVIFLPWTLGERTPRTLVERLVQAHGAAANAQQPCRVGDSERSRGSKGRIFSERVPRDESRVAREIETGLGFEDTQRGE